MQLVILTVACLSVVSAINGDCQLPLYDNLPRQQDVDVSKFVSKSWYQVGSFPTAGRDNREDFYYDGDEMKCTQVGREPGSTRCIAFHYRHLTVDNGYIRGQLGEDPGFTGGQEIGAIVMATDYDDYYLEFACNDSPASGVCANRNIALFVTNPQRTVSAAAESKAREIFAKLCLNYDDLPLDTNTGIECSY